MYEFVKSIIKKLIPKKSLFQHEEFLRSFFGIFYYGKSKQCNICNHSLRTFITTPTQDQLCPYCGSLSRTRRLHYLLENKYKPTGNILHFSPARCLYRRLKRNINIQYYSTDFEDQFIADHTYDITNIPVADNFFDFIICYHILEHILEDDTAIKELHRVLKPNSVMLIQTPFKEGAIYENPDIVSPKDRLEHFGQEDHVRIYSVDGLSKRIQAYSYNQIETLLFRLNEQHSSYIGLQENETIIEVTK